MTYQIDSPKIDSMTSAANMRGMFKSVPLSTIMKARPREPPDPATNSATTAPITDSPEEMRAPARM